MPNRILREGFLRSDKINSLKDSEQNFFIRLLLVSDDFGCFDARPEIVRSYCYPLTDIRPSTVGQMISQLHKVGLISIYSESGKNYLLIKNFDQRLRQKRRKYPQPPETIEDIINNGQSSDNSQTNDRQLQARMPESESESESESEKKKNKSKNTPTPFSSTVEEFSILLPAEWTPEEKEYWHDRAEAYSNKGNKFISWPLAIKKWRSKNPNQYKESFIPKNQFNNKPPVNEHFL